MALSSLNTNWLKGSYVLDRDYLLKVAENNGLRLGTDLSGLKPHYDGKDSIALGYGLDLLTNDVRDVKDYLSAVGITLTTTALSTIGSAKTTRNTLQGLVSQLAAEKDPIKRAALNTQIAGKKTELRNHATDLATVIQLRDEAHATDLLNVVATVKTKELEKFLGPDAPTDSREKAVLVSMWFNTPAYFRTGRDKDTNLTTSLRAGNRAEVWYEIRYGSSANGADGAGVVARRFAESEIFGLYNNAASVSPGEAREVYGSFTLHRARIADYEKRFGVAFDGTLGSQGNLIAQATTRYGLTGVNTVDYLHDAFNPAYQALFADLQARYPTGMSGLSAADFNPVNVLLDPGRDSTKQSFNSKHGAFLSSAVDPVTGQEVATRDILIGEDGNDWLMGGKGDDVLIGGKGLDYYYWRTLDGNDRIIDEDKLGIIVINDGAHDLFANGVFIKQGPSNIWKKTNTDGSELTLTHNSPWKIITGDGSEILLGDDFQSGDFGIHLVEESTPQTTRTLHGDLTPIDQDPGQAGLQLDYDALGNVKVNLSAAPGRDDTLYDSTGNDHLLGHGGNDQLLAFRGGDDVLDGGDGDDLLRAGDGHDHLLGGLGSDVLSGDAGDDALEGGLGEDHLQAGDGNDRLLGEQDNDALDGGAGDDVLEGGLGDDLLAGGTGSDIIYGGTGRDMILSATGLNLSPKQDRDGDGVPDDWAPPAGAGPVWTQARLWGIYDKGDGKGTYVVDGGGPIAQDTAGDVVFGEDGDDRVVGGLGSDYLDGGADKGFSLQTVQCLPRQKRPYVFWQMETQRMAA